MNSEFVALYVLKLSKLNYKYFLFFKQGYRCESNGGKENNS